MKISSYCLLSALMVIGLVSSGLAAGENHSHGMSSSPQKKSETAASDVQGDSHSGNKICPVMGGKVDKNISYEYKGKRYYFCCASCVDNFKADPEKYLKNFNPGEETKE